MELADKLKICRGKIGLTQLQIAERLNLSRKTISGWETGRSYPDIKSLVKLSEIFNISLDDLLKNDHILDYYEDQGKLSQQTNRVFFITYYFNLVLTILGYIDLFRPAGFHIILVPLALLINIFIVMTHYSNWKKFKKVLILISMLITFIFIFISISILIFTQAKYSNHLIQDDSGYNLGFMLSRILLTLLITSCTLAVLFFRPKHD